MSSTIDHQQVNIVETVPKSTKKVDRPFQKFIKNEASSGVILIGALGMALIWANTDFPTNYEEFWHYKLGFSLNQFEMENTLVHWIDDLLMMFFFLLVGLEIKRELLFGNLSNRKRALLPLFAAFGGMVVPALIYIMFNPPGSPGFRGWGIPMATDIAFALGVLYILGNRVPTGLRIFMASYAIFDDLGAVIIIAIFYTTDLNLLFLFYAIIFVGILALLNRFHVTKLKYYFMAGMPLWYALLNSGIHPTLAGVIIAAFIPGRQKIDFEQFSELTHDLIHRMDVFTKDQHVSHKEMKIYANTLHTLKVACDEVLSPLQRLEHQLSPLVTFAVIPIFVLANAGVKIESSIGEIFLDFVALGIFFGLVVGKPIGIYAISKLALNKGWGELPAGMNLGHLKAAGIIGGIGFTMSTFIATLSFTEHYLIEASRMSIVLASLISAVIGALYIIKRTKR